MIKNISLIFYYNKSNKYSFNALAGAIEIADDLDRINVIFCKSEDEVLSKVTETVNTDKVIIGFSFHTTQVWETFKIVKSIRKITGKSALLIAGGPHPTGDPLGTLKMGFDIVVRGEGEEALIELLRKIRDSSRIDDIKGISLMDENNSYFYSGRRALIDLDRYPPFSVKFKKFGPIEITRGCPYVCYFCQTPHIFGGRVRHRSTDIIFKYVEAMRDRGLNDIRFITPNAFSYGSINGKNVNIIKIKELLEGVRNILGKQGRIFFGTFPSEVRPEQVTQETIDLILKYTNNKNLIIGGQSGSQKILDICHRGHSVEEIYQAVEITKKSKLIPNVDFIFGLPQETAEDIKLTIKVINDLIKMGAKIHTHSFIPLPQTPFEKKNLKKIDNMLKIFIKNITSKGFAYGEWLEQERLSRKISKYLRTRILE